jgi:malate dehydrogenase (quinone)
MLQVLQRCMPERYASAQWQQRLKELIPSWGEDLGADAARLVQWRARSNGLLGLSGGNAA